MNFARTILVWGTLAILPAQNVPAQDTPAQGTSSPRSDATLHIYRQKLEMGIASHPAVSCDGFPVVRIQNGRVYTMKIRAGKHEIGTTDKPAGIGVVAQAAGEYFVRIDYPANSAVSKGAIPVQVPLEQGRMETAGLRRADGRYIEAATCGG